MFKQFQAIELLKDLNPVISKGMIGVIIEIWDEDNFEVEFVQKDGSNYEFEGKFTFTVNSDIIRRVKD
jgi:hypothetical protein